MNEFSEDDGHCTTESVTWEEVLVRQVADLLSRVDP